MELNYGNDPADQIVRFSLEGTEMALKLSGLAAKNFALFVYAVLKDQKKTRGKTRLVRMLKEQRPFKFFKIPAWQMKEFAREAKGHGLLYVPIRNKRDSQFIEIVSFADDASKIDYVASQAGEATIEKASAQEKAISAASIPENQQENPENFTAGRAEKSENPAAEKNPSEISSPSKSSLPGSVSREQKPSVKKELQEIRQEQLKKKSQKSKQQEQQISGRSRKKKKKAKSRS